MHIDCSRIIAIRGGFDGGCKDCEVGGGWWVEVQLGDEYGNVSEWICVCEDYMYVNAGTVNLGQMYAAYYMYVCAMILVLRKSSSFISSSSKCQALGTAKDWGEAYRMQ